MNLEAGHVLQTLGGELVMLPGGSLIQLPLPAACVAAFLLRRDRFSAGVLTLGLAQSLASVAAQPLDAPTRQLEMITSNPDAHDWWQVLGGWSVLNLADGLGRAVAFLAFAALSLGIVLAVWDELP